MLISGMTIGTAFTLFVLPSIYLLVAKTHKGISDKIAKEGRVPEIANVAA